MNYRQKRHARPGVVYVHCLDSTEGIPENMPGRVITMSAANPFGKPGKHYSETFRWTFVRYFPEDREPKP